MSLEHMTIAEGLGAMDVGQQNQSSTQWFARQKDTFTAVQVPAKVSMFVAVEPRDGPAARLVLLAQSKSNHLVRVPLSAPDIHSIVRHALDGKT